MQPAAHSEDKLTRLESGCDGKELRCFKENDTGKIFTLKNSETVQDLKAKGQNLES